jgi:hypothetical protein
MTLPYRFAGLLALGLLACAAPGAAGERPTRLFNGKDLSGLYTWVKGTGRQDPRKVFTVRDGMVHVSGEGLGYAATEKPYRDYRLVVEYRWGKRTDGGKYVRNSGILLHANGADGGANGAWMACVECQLAQGCVGDFIPIRGKDDKGQVIPVSFKAETVLGPDRRPRWKPGGEVQTFTNRQLWWSRHDPDFKELLDTRGKHDVESPVGRWTRVECVCRGRRIAVSVNGTKVNECFDVNPSSGKILLQCEGFEIDFRRFDLYPLAAGGGSGGQ